MKHTQYNEPEHYLEDRKGFDQNQYVIPFKTPQYKLTFPNNTEFIDPSELELKVIKKNENTS
jgi:hypothetical protein